MEPDHPLWNILIREKTIKQKKEVYKMNNDKKLGSVCLSCQSDTITTTLQVTFFISLVFPDTLLNNI